ncbi:hypothetical protein CRW58_23040 [Salmonella enterica subsp. enterica serovar Newport]|nr:hypothetical protein [Salmonella enterica subsp. enterica serovar Newport]
MVFADCRCDFMKVIPADVCDTGIELLYFAFLLLPVVAELNFAAYLPLECYQHALVYFKAVGRLVYRAIRKCCEFRDSGIQSDH